MKKYRIGAKALLEHYGQDLLLRDVFREIRHELRAQGLVVYSFGIDGREVLPELEESFQLMVSEIQEVDYLCENERKVILDQLYAWKDAIEELIQRSDEAVSKLTGNLQVQTRLEIEEILIRGDELLPVLCELREALAPYHEASNERMLNLESMTRQTVNELRESYQSQDFVLLSQVLEYDWGHILEQWRGTFVGFCSLLEAGDHVRNEPEPALVSHDSLARRRFTN